MKRTALVIEDCTFDGVKQDGITLLDRAMLLYYYCVPAECVPFDLNEKQYSDGVVRLIAQGFMANVAGLLTTDKGRVFCEALREVNLPEQVWVVRLPDNSPGSPAK